MSKENALFQQVKDDIAFDTLWPQVTETISTLSGKLWTDTDDHDPGVTLLQAVTWNISDFSYRASLSLNDLLTQDEVPTLFPQEFGPQNVLTCNTVTAEDYRRALRDLHASDTTLDGEDQDFLFSDACLIKEPEASRYHWWYSPEAREYSFSQPGDVEGGKEIFLRGNYWLYLLPTRYTLALKAADRTVVDHYLADFLASHRNLGEYVSRIIWLQPVDFTPKLTIELSGDVSDVNPLVARIFQVFDALLSPVATRRTTAQLQSAGYTNEAIFDGPFLQHGWQIDSASALADGSMTLNLSQLFNALLAIDGVESISQFSAGTLPKEIAAVSGDIWSWQVDSGYFPRLWGADPVNLLASAKSPLTLIAKGGIYPLPDAEQVKAYLTTPKLLGSEAVVLPAGKLRDLVAYTPVGNRLPECYQLQHPADVIGDPVRELHQFLLPVDQQLADGGAELAALPQLLAFKDRDTLNAIRGTRWPYATDSVSQQVHQDYAGALSGFQKQDAAVFAADGSTPNIANFYRELDFIQYLLGYFGTSRAARPLTLNLADFLATQRAFLAQHPSLGYDRINIRIDQVSALHKRIAARIGLNSECFADQPDLGKLPFYVIEHRQLLPLMPDEAFTEEQTPTGFSVDNKTTVTLKQDGSAGKIVQGQLIDLIADEGDSRLYVKQQLVTSTDGDSFTLSTANSLQLQNDLARLQAAWDSKKLSWQNSNTWLQDMDYRLNYADEQPDDQNQRLLASSDQSPYPTMVAVGDKIVITEAALATMPDTPAATSADISADADWQITAVIKELDTVTGTLLIEKESGDDFPAAENAWHFKWNFSEAAYATADRFSFVVSIVHNRSMVEAGNIDAAMLIDWMQREVMAEFPAHVSIINLWLSDSAFKNFAATYKRWQNNGTPLGDDAFALMEMLTLGHLPVAQLGIGLMRIATEAQKAEVVGSDGTGWDTSVIHEQELFYVPQDLPSA